jgi:hypothetical protein
MRILLNFNTANKEGILKVVDCHHKIAALAAVNTKQIMDPIVKKIIKIFYFLLNMG